MSLDPHPNELGTVTLEMSVAPQDPENIDVADLMYCARLNGQYGEIVAQGKTPALAFERLKWTVHAALFVLPQKVDQWRGP